MSVTYKARTASKLAQRKAEEYCRKKYGLAGADLLDDDSAGGHATFECVED